MSGPIIRIRNLYRRFKSGESEVTILKGLNLDIEAGEMVAIIGQSGSGKSTLMNILGCLDRPSDGEYYINGKNATGLSPQERAALRRENIGFIFQRYHLLADLKAWENVAIPAIYAGTAADVRESRAKALLTRLGLGDRTDHKPSQLSGGQQQRVSIARALMNGGQIIFADEPTGALDSHSGEEVMKILGELHAEGHTIILVTHDRHIAEHADRVIEIKDGEIIDDRRQDADGSASGKRAATPEVKKTVFGAAGRITSAISMAWRAILGHKLRAFLTMLGIIIGIASVVSVVALGNGSEKKILADISAMGTNTISIFPGRGFGDRRSGRIKTLTIDDAKVIAKQSYVASATPQTTSGGTLTYRNTDLSASLYGVGEQYFDVLGLKLESGRLFDETDVKEDAQVVVIDQNTKEKLFGADVNPLGKTVLFNKRPLTVIGVMKKEENSFGNADVLMLWSPYTTVMHQITGESHTNSITVKIKDDANTQVAEKGLTELLKTRHGTEDFFMNNSDSIKQMVETTTGTMKLLISSIALISLVVGGIGVMNIMLVSVTERTKEIGVRMAIGARRNNILQQFLIEAVLICIIGGLVGVGLSTAISLVFNQFVTEFPMEISIGSVIGAVVCSTAIGVAFGFMPANKASKLNPIDALSKD